MDSCLITMVSVPKTNLFRDFQDRRRKGDKDRRVESKEESMKRREMKPGVIELLVSLGADLYILSEDGLSPLQLAVLALQREALEELVAAGASLSHEVTAYWGGTQSLLHFAVEAERTEAIGWLLCLGADPNARDSEDQTPLQRAVAGGQPDIVLALLAGGARLEAEGQSGLEARDRRGWGLLHFAAWYGQPEVAEALLALEPEIESRNREGRTPLHLAAIQGDSGMAPLLLRYGAKVNARDGWTRTPLYYANRYRHTRQNRHDTAIADYIRTKGGYL